MHRAPLCFRRRTLVATLIALVSVHAPLRAAGQPETPPAPPPPAQSPTESAPTLAAPAPPAPIAPPVLRPADLLRMQELARLSAQLEQQRSANRRWQVPAIGLALGIVTFGVGWALFVGSQSEVGSTCYDDTHCGDYDERKFRAGVVLMMIGPALVLVSTPMLGVRAAREARMRRTESTIRRLGDTVAFAPLLGPRGEAGLRVHARF